MYYLINIPNNKKANKKTKMKIPQPTQTVRNCENCLNHVALIVDTNYIFFLMDFISKYYSHLDSNGFIAKLKSYFDQSSECATDGNLYVSENVFDFELNVINNPDCGLNTESQFLKINTNISDRNDLVNTFEDSLEKQFVNQDDIDKIIIIAACAYGAKAPKNNDLSLVTLGLNLSNDGDSKCLIITDDEKLKNLIKDHIEPEGEIEKADGDEWESFRLSWYHILDFLLNIYRYCNLTYEDADNMVVYYGEHFLFKRWTELLDYMKEIKARYISYYGKVLREYMREKHKLED